MRLLPHKRADTHPGECDAPALLAVVDLVLVVEVLDAVNARDAWLRQLVHVLLLPLCPSHLVPVSKEAGTLRKSAATILRRHS